MCVKRGQNVKLMVVNLTIGEGSGLKHKLTRSKTCNVTSAGHRTSVALSSIL
jgi:hypothetical protein